MNIVGILKPQCDRIINDSKVDLSQGTPQEYRPAMGKTTLELGKTPRQKYTLEVSRTTFK